MRGFHCMQARTRKHGIVIASNRTPSPSPIPCQCGQTANCQLPPTRASTLQLLHTSTLLHIYIYIYTYHSTTLLLQSSEFALLHYNIHISILPYSTVSCATVVYQESPQPPPLHLSRTPTSSSRAHTHTITNNITNSPM
jgi:hypothetical protein